MAQFDIPLQQEGAASVYGYITLAPTAGTLFGFNPSTKVPESFATLTYDGSGHLTIAEAKNLSVGTTTGTKIGTAVTQKLGFWNATPVVQPASTNQSALTDSTTGTPSTTLGDVGAVFSQTAINNNFASILRLLNQLRNDLVTTGLSKGSA